MITLLRDKRKGGNPMRKLPPQCKRSSIKSLNKRVIRIIQLTQASVELFFDRGAYDTETRAYPVS